MSFHKMTYGKAVPQDIGSPYEYPPMMTRPNSLYLPPSSYDVMVGGRQLESSLVGYVVVRRRWLWVQWQAV